MVQGQFSGSTSWLVSPPPRSFSSCQVETRVSPASLQCGAVFQPFVNRYQECPTRKFRYMFQGQKAKAALAIKRG